MIEKLSKFWAGAIAYVALLAGAGLSVAGNVADTFRTRGEATDALDIILAGAWPILVLLTIELFVSGRWSSRTGYQILRWFGCLSVGSMAMLVSWVHLHDLLATRGQLSLVSMAGPLAIDGMAIMATGLILSTRAAAVAMMAMPEAIYQAEPLSSWMDRMDNLATEMDATTSPAFPLDIVSVSPAPSSNVVRPESVPADAADMIVAWAASDPDTRPKAGQADEYVALAMDVTPRTARRWRYAVTKA